MDVEQLAEWRRHFARTLGAARSGNAAAARVDAARLAELQGKLRDARDAYWAEQVGIQRDIAEAWILYADAKHDEALKRLQAAADAEDRTDKHVVTPGPLAPAREMLGAMLLTRGRNADALAAFEATLRKEPRRLSATIGAAQAAAGSGHPDVARHHYAAALSLAGGAALRPELAEAQAWLSVSGR